MPSANSQPRLDVIGPHPAGLAAAEAYLSLCARIYRTSAEAALWWSRKWVEAPAAFLAWSPLRYAATKTAPAPQDDKPVAPVIHLAQAVAARAAAEMADAAAEVVEIVETAAETPIAITKDTLSVATAAAETVASETLTPDDLTRLVGIGPKLSASLAERGVTRFAHIAGWTAADLAEFDKSLDLKGRAVRDAWVAQAKRFLVDPPAG